MIITSTSPVNGSHIVELSDVIIVEFDKNIEPGSVDSGSILITYKSPNVGIIDTSDITSSSSIYSSDKFLNTEAEIYLEGSVAVDNNKITFTPKSKLLPETIYDVYISDTIQSTDGESLEKIYHFRFTTVSESVAYNEVEVPQDLTSILGTDFVENEISSKLTVNKVTPNSFIFNGAIKIEFNQNISTVDLEIKPIVLEDDFYEEDLQYSTNITDKIVTISFTPENNKIYQVTILSTTTSTEGDILGKDYAYNFVKKFDPYYTSVKMVKLMAGTLLGEHEQLHIASLIYYFSVEADLYIKNLNISKKFKDFIIPKYTLMKTLKSLLYNNNNLPIYDSYFKKIGEYSIKIDTRSKIELYNQLIKSIYKWENDLEKTVTAISTNPFFARNSMNVISDIGRLWIRGTKSPAINGKASMPDNMFDINLYIEEL